MLSLLRTSQAGQRTFLSGLAARRTASTMGAIVKKTGPVDTNARLEALRNEMQKENVEA